MKNTRKLHVLQTIHSLQHLQPPYEVARYYVITPKGWVSNHLSIYNSYQMITSEDVEESFSNFVLYKVIEYHHGHFKLFLPPLLHFFARWQVII